MTRALATLAAVGLAAVALAACGSGSSSSGGGASARQAGGVGGPGRNAGAPARRVPALTLPANPRPRSVRVPILTYHRVHVYATELTKSTPDLTIEPSVFAAEIAALDRHGYHAISQGQLYEALFEGRALPPKPVLISVDDGYVDGLEEILPVLRRHHMIATFYIITGRFHEPGFLTAGQVRRLDAAGMDIGAHTRTHVSLPALSGAALISQVAGSRHDLERVLGHPVDFFAYPYGVFTPAVVSAVRRAGFVLAVTTQGGTRESSLAPLTMPRIHVGRAMSPASVLAAAAG
jgi:peptidoglycan/xylan/chitin deacetylase (PgdA/CDA1 family)